jgi:hypothetical protein
MIAFDTDVLTEILLGNAAFVKRASTIPIEASPRVTQVQAQVLASGLYF